MLIATAVCAARASGAGAAGNGAQPVASPQDPATVLWGEQEAGVRTEPPSPPPASGSFALPIGERTVRWRSRLFGDLGAGWSERPAERAHTAFAFGSLDLFLTARLDESVQLISETLLEAGEEGVALDQERLWLRYRAAAGWYVKFGLEHAPLSRWNRRFHHGRWLYPALEPPMLARFEDDGGLLGIHEVGLELGDTWNTPAGRLETLAAVSNGRAARPDRRQLFDDGNDAKAIDLAVALRPRGAPSLRLEAATHYDEIPPLAGQPDRRRSMREWVARTALELTAGPIELLGEAVFVQHRDRVARRTFHHASAYLQFAATFGPLTPYARIDTRDMERDDPFYALVASDLDANEANVGLRWDPTESVALKLELGYRWAQRRTSGGELRRGGATRVGLQLAWVF
ncbi:MAG: hypothetical protein D6776_05515 [Planctomycetota bacterium]|nr:MAG: hypothetical protein D6776_05515 [Planctomycetota bacterium]